MLQRVLLRFTNEVIMFFFCYLQIFTDVLQGILVLELDTTLYLLDVVLAIKLMFLFLLSIRISTGHFVALSDFIFASQLTQKFPVTVMMLKS